MSRNQIVEHKFQTHNRRIITRSMLVEELWGVYFHDDVIKWKHFSRNWPFVWGIHRSPVNCPHKSQWRGALTLSLPYAWINDWVNNRDVGDLRRCRAHYDATVMFEVVYRYITGVVYFYSGKSEINRVRYWIRQEQRRGSHHAMDTLSASMVLCAGKLYD